MELRSVYKLIDGEMVLIHQEEIKPSVPTEELIAQKEAELLEMYNELKALKGE